MGNSAYFARQLGEDPDGARVREWLEFCEAEAGQDALFVLLQGMILRVELVMAAALVFDGARPLDRDKMREFKEVTKVKNLRAFGRVQIARAVVLFRELGLRHRRFVTEDTEIRRGVLRFVDLFFADIMAQSYSGWSAASQLCDVNRALFSPDPALCFQECFLVPISPFEDDKIEEYQNPVGLKLPGSLQ